MTKGNPAILPILDDLARANTDAERALFCLAVSDAIIIGHFVAIGVALRVAEFTEGYDYVLLRYAASTSVREPDGLMLIHLRESLEGLRLRLVAVVEERT